MSFMNDPNLSTIVWRKPNPTSTPTNPRELSKALKQGTVQTVTRQKDPVHVSSKTRSRLLEDAPEDTSLTKVSKDMANAIANARRDKKNAEDKSMTQVELAKAVNVHTSVIKSYENGTAIPDANLINKINRVLDVDLRKTSKAV